MSQLDRHLTTEELSVLLDDQFEPEEAGAELRGHLTTCQQCQYELAELRQTVHLLHALPQPALPRSFVLPAGMLQITTTDTQTQNVSNIHISGSTNRTQPHRPTRTSIGRRVLNLVGTLAAVVGILFILSGFITVMPHMAASSSTASTTASAPNIAMPANQSAASTAGRSLAPAATDEKQLKVLRPFRHPILRSRKHNRLVQPKRITHSTEYDKHATSRKTRGCAKYA